LGRRSPIAASARAWQVHRISRVVADLAGAERFYRDALGFQTDRTSTLDPATATDVDLPEAAQIEMRLGGETIVLVQAANRTPPADSRSNDLWFQHLAIVVADMDAAYAQLSRASGWRPITEGGPQRLPEANGGVRAFKFRDPDHHPLELIWFPPGQGRPVWHQLSDALFLGIDHTALAATPPAVAFYQSLGFQIAARSLNEGPAQSKLDAIPDARAHITSLRPSSPRGPGIELLCYDPPGRPADLAHPTQWTTITASATRVLRDPDGHLLRLDQN
jgi:catechol 2,3-dioxygenase-like lactoylglutathione lyase family enzyme